MFLRKLEGIVGRVRGHLGTSISNSDRRRHETLGLPIVEIRKTFSWL